MSDGNNELVDYLRINKWEKMYMLGYYK